MSQLWRTTNGGTTFEEVTPPGWNGSSGAASLVNPYQLFVCQKQDVPRSEIVVWGSTNGGTSWECLSRLAIRSEATVATMRFLSLRMGYIRIGCRSWYEVGGYGAVLTKDGGVSWDWNGPGGFEATDAVFLDTLTGFVFCEGFCCAVNLWRTDNGGDSWHLIWTYDPHVQGDFIFFLPELMFPDTLTGYIIGGNYLERRDTNIFRLSLLKTTNGGTQWEVVREIARWKDEDEFYLTHFSFASPGIGYLASQEEPENSDVRVRFWGTNNGRGFVRLPLPARRTEELKVFPVTGTSTVFILCTDDRDSCRLFKSANACEESTGFWSRLAHLASKPARGALMSWVAETEALYLLDKKTGHLMSLPSDGDSWHLRTTFPISLKRGSMTGYQSGLALLITGTNQCWHYDATADCWTRLPDIPGCQIGRGGGITSDENDPLFVLKGGATREFWSFDFDDDTWQRRPDIPGSPVKAGGCIACDGALVYSLPGGRSNEVWAFDLAGDSWFRLPDVPAGRPKEGSQMAANQYAGTGPVVLLKRSTNECWSYVPGRHWRLQPGVPGRKKYGLHGQFCADNAGRLQALKGVSPWIIWQTDELTTDPLTNPLSSEAIAGSDTAGTRTSRRTWFQPESSQMPEPGYRRVSVYDVSGRLCHQQRTAGGVLPLSIIPGSLPRGLYFIHTESAGSRSTEKTVVGR